MGVILANNAASTLASGIAAGDLSLTLQDAAAFPSPGAGEWFYATLVDSSETKWEVVKMTDLTGDDLMSAAATQAFFTALIGRYAEPLILQRQADLTAAIPVVYPPEQPQE